MKKQRVYIYVAIVCILLMGCITGCFYWRQNTKIDFNIVSAEAALMNTNNLPFIFPETKTDLPVNRESDLYAHWLDEYLTKDFLIGRVQRNTDPLFVKLDEEHIAPGRNIYLLKPVYEAYKKMCKAALAEGVKLIVTSGHRTFMEQACEWELRWNNPGESLLFNNELEKAQHVLQYRSMPGTSRHHWGTDIDLNSFRLSYFETIEGKKMYTWLKKHASEYGFYQPYSTIDEKRPVGYQEEMWHWSYRPLAQYMLEKYLELVTIDDIKGFKGDRAVMHLDLFGCWVSGIDPILYDAN